MPQTKTSRRAATSPRQSAAARKPPAASKPRATSDREPKQTRPVDRTVDLSEEVLRSLESGQRAAIDAVRKFVDTVDKTLPALGERPSRRQEVVDAAMDMADRLVHTQYDFIRDVVQSAGKALSRQDGRK
jgi:hypothetical protein